MINLSTIRATLTDMKTEHNLNSEEKKAISCATFILGMLETMMVSVETEAKDFDYLRKEFYEDPK